MNQEKIKQTMLSQENNQTTHNGVIVPVYFITVEKIIMNNNKECAH